ncbi:MAG TPA: hypothetical protein VF556_08180 [Pyrinomonadaceae bacterium]|jgi:hypothetical protein
MKIKILAAVGLSAIFLLGGCRGGSNTNTANTAAHNTNANTMTMMTPAPTPVLQTNENSAVDTTLKTKTEAALKAKGFNDVTVDTSTNPATLRGTVAKGKMAEAVRTAQEAAGKPFTNQITEK